MQLIFRVYVRNMESSIRQQQILKSCLISETLHNIEELTSLIENSHEIAQKFELIKENLNTLTNQSFDIGQVLECMVVAQRYFRFHEGGSARHELLMAKRLLENQKEI